MTAESTAVTGTVNTHANSISFKTAHRTLETLSPAPAPIMDILTTCVVLTGPPKKEDVRITAADDNCEVKLCIGLIR